MPLLFIITYYIYLNIILLYTKYYIIVPEIKLSRIITYYRN